MQPLSRSEIFDSSFEWAIRNKEGLNPYDVCYAITWAICNTTPWRVPLLWVGAHGTCNRCPISRLLHPMPISDSPWCPSQINGSHSSLCPRRVGVVSPSVGYARDGDRAVRVCLGCLNLVGDGRALWRRACIHRIGGLGVFGGRTGRQARIIVRAVCGARASAQARPSTRLQTHW